MKTPDELEKLSLLLDDEDDNVAINVIAALLDRQDELGDLPARLQESSNELVRKRAHQLQAAITFRKRRQDFAALLEAENPDFYAGLVLLHMLWFDRDSQVNVRADLEKFIAENSTDWNNVEPALIVLSTPAFEPTWNVAPFAAKPAGSPPSSVSPNNLN